MRDKAITTIKSKLIATSRDCCLLSMIRQTIIQALRTGRATSVRIIFKRYDQKKRDMVQSSAGVGVFVQLCQRVSRGSNDVQDLVAESFPLPCETHLTQTEPCQSQLIPSGVPHCHHHCASTSGTDHSNTTHNRQARYSTITPASWPRKHSTLPSSKHSATLPPASKRSTPAKQRVVGVEY